MLAVAPLIALIIFLGVYPKPVLDIINPAVKATLHDVAPDRPGAAARHGRGGGRSERRLLLAAAARRRSTTPSIAYHALRRS